MMELPCLVDERREMKEGWFQERIICQSTSFSINLLWITTEDVTPQLKKID
jgi:hypothetical protein